MKSNFLFISIFIWFQDPGSVLSGETLAGQDSIDEDRSVTCRDIKLIMPTVIILIFTLFVIVTVIPYAFSAVIKQLQGVWAMEEQSKEYFFNL